MSRPASGVATTGTGRVAVVPDVAVVRLGAQVTDAEAATAHQAAAAGASALVEALVAAGVERRALRTAGTSSWTDPGETGGQPRAPRTTVTISVEARLAPERAGELVQVALAAAGESGRLESTQLQVSDPGAARAAARAQAFAEARAAAEQLAALAGRALGEVVEVVEGGVGAAPVLARMAAMPVEAGEQEVAVTLAVRHRWA